MKPLLTPFIFTIRPLSLLLCLFLFCVQFNNNAYSQCSAISSIDFAAHNPSNPDIHYGDGSNTYVIESLEQEDYACFETVPFFVELAVAPDAGCEDYTVELDMQWLCNTTGQGGIGVSDIVLFQINDASDPGSANLDGDEAISNLGGFSITGTPLSTTDNSSCTLDATFEVTGLDPGDKVIVRIDVLLDCNINARPTGNIQASLMAARITSGTGTDCTCGNLQGGAQNHTLESRIARLFLHRCAYY